jgi:myo-inositol 2-dehydrogenase / D-chiro-inositol 1-dehydrogenase
MGADHAVRVARRTAGAELVAVSDTDPGRAEAVANPLGGVRVIPDAAELIADPKVDAVLIASSAVAHEEQVLACIEQAKYTLCEKPLTLDRASALRVVDAEAAFGRRLIQVGFMRRFDPEYVRMKTLLDSGRFGRLLMMHNVHRNKQSPEWFQTEYIVRDSLVHEVDIARFLFGEEIVEINVLTPTPTSAVTGLLDPQLAIFRMSGGAIVNTEVFVNAQVGYEVRCEAVAERGTITIGQPSGGVYTTGVGGTWGGEIPDDYLVRFQHAYDHEVQAWVDACRDDEVIGPSTWDGYAATAVCEAGMESLRTGRPVRVML